MTVVSGVPRSGTSLMMQMLGAGGMPLLTDEVRGADEDNPRGYFEFEPVKRTREDAGWVWQARGKAVKVIYALLRDLPDGFEYRVVMMRRNWDEVVASQRAMLVRLGRPGANIAPARMAAIFEAELREMREWLGRQGHFKVLEIDYGECREGPGQVAARVNRFVGGGLDEAGMAAAFKQELQRRAGRPA